MTSSPSSRVGECDAAAAAPIAVSAAAERPLAVALYVHVPFCRSKCAYCDFYSLAGHEQLQPAFVDAALFEAGHWSHYDLLDDVPSLYVGGGTPTALGGELPRLVAGLLETACLRSDADITVETNPETTDAALVDALVAAGVGRFSLGVQSFDDAVLRVLGRPHDARRAADAARLLAASGASLSLDLICGAPGQTEASWRGTLHRAVETGASHLSVYPLSVEGGTPLEATVAAGSVAAPDPDVAAEMMLTAESVLRDAGLYRYEVANYARPGSESRHNLVYWQGGAYLGIGPHAASMLPFRALRDVASSECWALGQLAEDGQPARARFSRDVQLLDYLKAPLASPGPFELLSAAQTAREDVMLGLRLVRGVTHAAVEAAGLPEVLRRLEGEGLVESEDGRWRTTERGWLLGNRVFGAVWNG